MKPDLFRKTAIERMSTPDRLDVLLTIARPRHWMALISIVMLLVIFFFWSVTAQIPVLFTGPGVFAAHGESVYIAAAAAGQITDVGMQAGQRIERGQTAARMYNPDWVRLAADAPAELSRQAADMLLERSKVISSHSGTIRQVFAVPGQWVEAGEPLALLEIGHANRPPIVTMYVPLNRTEEIPVGAQARIWPNGHRGGRGAAWSGKVERVSLIPAAPDTVEKTMGGQEIAAEHLQEGPLAEVRIILDAVPTVHSEDHRTAGAQSSSAYPQPGMLCSVDLIIDTLYPIEWIFPFKR